MSCDTLNRAAVQLSVAAGSLPEGFCPESLQDFFNAMVDRLIISPSTDFNTFVIGSTAPPSNQGPWLKDCAEWFVYDDATGTYIPITKQGFSNQSYVITSGTFIVPEFIYKLKITAFGAGGGGFDSGAAQAAGAGGGGACGISIVAVTPGQSISYMVGVGGVAGNPGTAGGATTLLGLSATGGGGGTGAVAVGGAGGVATGFDINLTGQSGTANVTGTADESTSIGGDAGGWGGKGGVLASNAVTTGRNGTAPGGGGTGAANATASGGGNGADGAILFEW